MVALGQPQILPQLKHDIHSIYTGVLESRRFRTKADDELRLLLELLIVVTTSSYYRTSYLNVIHSCRKTVAKKQAAVMVILVLLLHKWYVHASSICNCWDCTFFSFACSAVD